MEQLNEKRSTAADAAYCGYEFGDGVEVEDQSGWEYTTSGNEWVRPVYVSTPEEDDFGRPTQKLTFTVRFKPGSDQIEDAYAIDEKGSIWGIVPMGKAKMPCVQVVLTAFYPVSRNEIETIAVCIRSEMDAAIGRGLLSHAEFTPDEFELAVTGMDADAAHLDEEQVTEWMSGSVESGVIKLEEVPRLLARYALTGAADMRVEIAERMGLAEQG